MGTARDWGWVGRMMAAAAAGVVAVGASASGLVAQDPQRVRVFLDCQTRGCDAQEFRTEIDYVDWVRERTAAEVHVLVTGQDAGAGTQYVFDFVGGGPFEGEDLRLLQTVSSTATRDERLRGLTRTLAAGLVPYIARRGYADRLEIRHDVAGPIPPIAAADDDPWNLWVFTMGAGLEANGEERESSQELNASFSANRTSPSWKIESELQGWFYHREVVLNDGETFVNTTEDWQFSVLAAQSVSRHWSAGSELEVNSSTRLNRAIGGRAALALEWNLFPYEEANRRQFLVHYQLGISRVRYDELTIFEQIQETLYDHRLAVVYENRQPWGDASMAVLYSNYLQDFGKFRVSTRGETSVRLLRGLELDVEASYDVIRDQVYLPAEELTDEEILVQRRQLRTGFEYRVDLGLSYRFGSIFNNVVNNRFPWVVRDFD